MPYSRYDKRLIFYNTEKIYSDYIVNKKLNFIRQYTSPKFSRTSQTQYNDLTVSEVMWTTGDRLWKLAHNHYGSPKYWWVIGLFNNKPTDSHFKVGDTVYLPFPLEKVLSYVQG